MKDIEEMVKELSDNINKILSTDLSKVHMIGNDMTITSGTINAADIDLK